MTNYPVILIPDAIKCFTEPPIKPSQPARPKQPKKPPSPPSEPQPFNTKELLFWGGGGLLISWLIGFLFSFISQGWGVGLMSVGLILIIILILAKASFDFKSFPQRKQAHELLQQQYLKRLDNYAIALSKFDVNQANYQTALTNYHEQLTTWQEYYNQLKSILTNVSTYEGKKQKFKRGQSESKFESYLRQYFRGKINTGLTVQPDYDKEFPYIPDFAYIDLDSNLHIDIEIDEPYRLDNKQPIHYLGLEKEEVRDRLFINSLWIVIRFSEEQIIKYPQSCCKTIAEVISNITGDNSILEPFINTSILEYDPRWTYEEALKMAENNYRETYQEWE